MPSGLTGDFDAVLEVNGGTFNRLLAAMHQNGYADPARPSFPHVAHLRLGDDGRDDGPRGSVSAQIGVPRLVLIDGASERFGVEAGFRAGYRPDPDTPPLAGVIHGTVHAEYVLHDIDDDCRGWRGVADAYAWPRVVKSSVSFDGTVEDDPGLVLVPSVLDEAVVKQLVTEQLAVLLDTRLAPAPLPIGQLLRRGVRCRSSGPAPDESAIVIPVGLSGETPAGDPASVGELFLGPSDFGLAVSGESLIARVQSSFDLLAGRQRDFHVHGDLDVLGGVEIDYHVRLDAAGAQWLGPSFAGAGQGAIRVSVRGSGWASRLYTSGLADTTSLVADDLRLGVTVDQLLTLSFDPVGERLVISPSGSPSVSASSGIPFADLVMPLVEAKLSALLQANLGGVLDQAQQQLAGLTADGPKRQLVAQLKRIDGAASARFSEAVFRSDGLVVRGAIALSRRHRPQVTFEKSPRNDGFDAVETWIPGGQVESFEWGWHWYTTPIQDPPGRPGTRVERHDLLLRRPFGGMTKFGMLVLAGDPLPGLDGNGKVCLTITGDHVDPVTGALVPIEGVTECVQFGHEFHMPFEVAPWTPICDPLLGPEHGPPVEIGIQQVSVSAGARPGFNVLLLLHPGAWDGELVAALADGLDGCGREGAGLLVQLLFPEGCLQAAGPEVRVELQTLAERLEAPLLVSEDIGGTWTRALELRDGTGEPAWRLLAPDGELTWAADGHFHPKELSGVLDERLVASAPPALVSVQPAVGIGELLPIGLVAPPCPPVPLVRAGLGGSKLVFAQAAHDVSLMSLVREQRDGAPDGTFVAAVVAGADAEEVARLQSDLALDFPLFPDPDGSLTREAGVSFWPTTLALDDRGRLAAFTLGARTG